MLIRSAVPLATAVTAPETASRLVSATVTVLPIADFPSAEPPPVVVDPFDACSALVAASS